MKALFIFSFAFGLSLAAGDAINIGTRRELFVHDALIESVSGEARLELHHPEAREIALEHSAAWEGSGSGYHSVFRDGDLYRMYYKAWHLEVSDGKVTTDRHPLFCCYAESPDGIRWSKPALGLYDFQGSAENNIVMVSGVQGPLNVDAGHPAVFRDENPAAAEDARYKAILRSEKPGGLLPFKSPDGIHWTPMTDAPILSGLGAFDSQNLAFWDPVREQYREYHRGFKAGVRDIMTSTSDDFSHFGEPQWLAYTGVDPEHLYTCLLYTSPSPRDRTRSRMPSSA